MNESDLRSLLERHNQRELAWGVFIAFTSVLLWLISYVIVAVFVLLIVAIIFRQYPHAVLVNSITLVVMAVLLFDGIRFTGKLFDFDRYRNSFYSIGANQIHASVSGSDVSVTHGNPLQAAFGISQFLLCAPRSSLAAFRHVQSRVRIDDDQICVATKLFHELAQTRSWIDVVRFGKDAGTLAYLDVADLLWTRVHHGLAQVKLSPSARSEHLGE